MNKNFKIWGIRSNLAGDLIFALPILNYLELKYPSSYKYWVIAKKCAGFAPIFFNHPLIDCIRITEGHESLGEEDIKIAKSCDLYIDVTPQHPDGMPGTTKDSCWWNFYNVYEETFRMAGFDVEEYRKMPNYLQFPRLIKWFDVENNSHAIGIWPFTSYGVLSKRSPSLDWYYGLTQYLLDNTKYHIMQFGATDSPSIFHNTNDRAHLFNHLPIFEQIKKSLSCLLTIGTDSGSSAIMGAYGHKQITLLTTDTFNHYQNISAFAPLNYNNKNINLINIKGCNNISYSSIVSSINLLKL